MNLSQKHKEIFTGDRCPYCNSLTKYINQAEIYGTSYSDKKVIVCRRYPKCDSYVGTHKDGSSLGRLANKELRLKKIETHSHFDPIWQGGYMKRKNVYKWLSRQLGIPNEYCHIGCFSIKTCDQVIELSKEKLKHLKRYD